MSEMESPAAVETSIEWIRDFEKRFFEAWNSRQVDRVLELMTEDIEYRDDHWYKTMRGHADARQALDAYWIAFPDLTFEVMEGPYVIPGQPRAATYWRGSGTHTGRFDPPGFGATGRRWQGDGVNISEYRDGRLCRLRICTDTFPGRVSNATSSIIIYHLVDNAPSPGQRQRPLPGSPRSGRRDREGAIAAPGERRPAPPPQARGAHLFGTSAASNPRRR